MGDDLDITLNSGGVTRVASTGEPAPLDVAYRKVGGVYPSTYSTGVPAGLAFVSPGAGVTTSHSLIPGPNPYRCFSTLGSTASRSFAFEFWIRPITYPFTVTNYTNGTASCGSETVPLLSVGYLELAVRNTSLFFFRTYRGVKTTYTMDLGPTWTSFRQIVLSFDVSIGHRVYVDGWKMSEAFYVSNCLPWDLTACSTMIQQGEPAFKFECVFVNYRTSTNLTFRKYFGVCSTISDGFQLGKFF
jgi:hypothetical protein